MSANQSLFHMDGLLGYICHTLAISMTNGNGLA